MMSGRAACIFFRFSGRCLIGCSGDGVLFEVSSWRLVHLDRVSLGLGWGLGTSRTLIIVTRTIIVSFPAHRRGLISAMQGLAM